MRPRLALVPGEPGGIGPELCVRLAQQCWASDFVAFADPDVLSRAARALDLPLRLLPSEAIAGQGELAVRPVHAAVPAQFGVADPANGPSVVTALREAAQACLQGHLHGMVTGPVNKASINAAGIPFTGTTELLAAEAGVPVVMMLANPRLRVALATTHLPLRAVADAITREGLSATLHILHAALQRDFGIARPRIAVLGLNPHAGECGELGDEEITRIQPVLEALRADGMQLAGPLPADTAFLPSVLAGVDAVLAMYHDQGLPVLKYSGFEDAVNLTLGLPFPRVAVDHGTALPLAGTGRADPSSLFAAATLCGDLAQRRYLNP